MDSIEGIHNSQRSTTYPLTFPAHPQVKLDVLQCYRFFNQYGSLKKIDLMLEELPHAVQVVVHFNTPEGRRNAAKLKQEDVSILLGLQREKKSPTKTDEIEVKSPATLPYEDGEQPMRPAEYAESPNLYPPPTELCESSPSSELYSATVTNLIPETPTVPLHNSATILAVPSASPMTPGCEPQLDVVEPLENRVVTTTPRHGSRRFSRARRNNMSQEGKPERARSITRPVPIYRQPRNPIPRTNSGRRVGIPQPDTGAYRTQNASRVSRNMREARHQESVILAIEETPTPRSDYLQRPDSLSDRTRTPPGMSRLALRNAPSGQSVESSIHTDSTGSSRLGTPGIEQIHLHIRLGERRAKLVFEPDMTLRSLKNKMASAFDISDSVRLWNPRSNRFLEDEVTDDRTKLTEIDLTHDDELVIVVETYEEKQQAAPAPRGNGRFQQMEERRRKVNRAHRSRTSPNVLPRSREPPAFGLQEFPDDSPQFDTAEAAPIVVSRNPSAAVHEIQQNQAQRRRRIRDKRSALASSSLPISGEPNRRSSDGFTNRNRPVSTKTRVSIPSIALPHQSRSSGHLTERKENNRGTTQSENTTPATRRRPHRSDTYHHPPPHSRSNTRVRLSEKMVIRRPRRGPSTSNSSILSNPISLGDLDFDSQMSLSLGPETSQTFLAAQEQISSTQNIINSGRNDLTEFASVVNFVAPESHIDERANHRQRRVKVKQSQQRPYTLRYKNHRREIVSEGSRSSLRRAGSYRSQQSSERPHIEDPNQALFIFSDEGPEPPLPPDHRPQQYGPPTMMEAGLVSRRDRRVSERYSQQLVPPSAIGTYDPSSHLPASPLFTEVASPRDDELLAMQLAQEDDLEQQRTTQDYLQNSLFLWDGGVEEKYPSIDEPEIRVVPRRGFVVNDDSHELNTIFERLAAVSPDVNRFELATYEELLQLDDAVPSTGLSEREIWRLPLRTLTTEEQRQQAGSCSICQEDYVINDELRRLPCMHEYHRKCIDQWLDRSKKCPVDMNIVRV